MKKKLKKEIDEVLVALRIQEVGEIDKTVIRMIDEGKTGEALLQKALAIEMLKEVLNKDTTGFVSRMLANAEQNYEDLKNKKKDVRAVRKNLDYNGYLHRRASIEAMREMEINVSDVISENPSVSDSSNTDVHDKVTNRSRNRRIS